MMTYKQRRIRYGPYEVPEIEPNVWAFACGVRVPRSVVCEKARALGYTAEVVEVIVRRAKG